MKRMTKIEIKQKAENIKFKWTCGYGLQNADDLSKAIRKLFIKEKKNSKLRG